MKPAAKKGKLNFYDWPRDLGSDGVPKAAEICRWGPPGPRPVITPGFKSQLKHLMGLWPMARGPTEGCMVGVGSFARVVLEGLSGSFWGAQNHG